MAMKKSPAEQTTRRRTRCRGARAHSRFRIFMAMAGRARIGRPLVGPLKRTPSTGCTSTGEAATPLKRMLSTFILISLGQSNSVQLEDLTHGILSLITFLLVVSKVSSVESVSYK